MAETKKEKPIPLRLQLIFDIKFLLNQAYEIGEGIYIEKLISGFMIKKGIARRTILECVDAIKYSGYAEVFLNDKKEQIIKRKVGNKDKD